MKRPGDVKRIRWHRVRQTILEWMFPLSGTVVLLIAMLVAIFHH